MAAARSTFFLHPVLLPLLLLSMAGPSSSRTTQSPPLHSPLPSPSNSPISSPEPAAPLHSPFHSPPAPPGPAPSPHAPSSPSPAPSSPSPAPAFAGIHSADSNDIQGLSPPSSEKKRGLSGGQKAGIGLGVVVGATVVGVGAVVYKKRQENMRRSQYGYATRRDML